MSARRASVIIMVSGALAALTAILASELGIDPHAGWGSSRLALLLLGIVALLAGATAPRLLWGGEGRPRADSVADVAQRMQLSGLRVAAAFRSHWAVLPIMVLVIAVYIWFASNGTWTTWQSPSRYFADLSRGFMRGNLYLPTRPGPDLLNLENPYDPAARGDLNRPALDYSLYEGRFYLYWGPVPSLMLMAVSPLVPGRVGDLFLAFGFASGVFVVQTLLSLLVWNRHFRALPAWILPASLLVVGLSGPTLFMLNNYNAGTVYEVAIIGGQFFWLLGLYLTSISAGQPASAWAIRLAAGAAWGLAIGTRLVQVAPAAAVLLLVAVFEVRQSRALRAAASRLGPILIPLMLSAAGLGWYNWARFGSVFETGLYYQLAGVNIMEIYADLFSPAYILQNAYNYLFTPFATSTAFPYLQVGQALAGPVVSGYMFPAAYAPKTTVGILALFPVLIFALLAFVDALARTFRERGENVLESDQVLPSRDGVVLTLAAATAASLGVLLCYFWVGIRFVEDFVPTLAILSAFGFWAGLDRLRRERRLRRLYLVLGALLGGYGVLVGILLGLSTNTARLQIISLMQAP